MTETAAPLDLDAIRARAARASEGPWRVVLDDSESATTVWRQCVSEKHPADDPNRLGVYDECCFDGGLHSEPFYREADAEFVAHARTDVPALLAEVERLRAGANKVIANFEATAAMNREIGDKAEAEHNETLAWKLRRDILGEAS